MSAKFDSKKYNDLIKRLLHGETWEERADSARELGHVADGRALNIMHKALNKEKDSGVINRILEAFGNLKDPRATMIIVKYLQEEMQKEEPDRKRLFLIIESLMKIGDKRALEHLGILQKACYQDEELKGMTEEALNCIDPNWLENINTSKE